MVVSCQWYSANNWTKVKWYYYFFSLHTLCPFTSLFSLSMRKPKYFTVVKHWRYLTPPQQVFMFSSLGTVLFSHRFSIKHRSRDERLGRHKIICLVTFINQIVRIPFPHSLEGHVFCSISWSISSSLLSCCLSVSLYPYYKDNNFPQSHQTHHTFVAAWTRMFLKRQCLNMTNGISPTFGRVTAKAEPDIYRMLYETTNISLNHMGCHVTQNTGN